MGPPAPSLSFTIPSIHDDLKIECRIYHPSSTVDKSLGHQVDYTKTAVILAHPYAPLGGCNDVPVILVVTAALLKEGVIVGTFNFRGAAGSKGRTTWTGKGELADYESFVGLMVSYLNSLGVNQAGAMDPCSPLSSDHATLEEGLTINQSTGGVNLVLGGYSYGSLVVMRLPSVSEILAKFSKPAPDSAMAEIISCARTLASETNQDLASQRNSQSQNHSLRVGGEDGAEARRSSRENRRSVEILRRSLDMPRSIKKMRSKGNESAASGQNEDIQSTGDRCLTHVKSSYLLISPLLSPVSNLVMLPSRHSKTNSAWIKHPAFAVFGDQDFFTSFRKLSQWAQRTSAAADSDFNYAAVTGAGHFWIEEGVEGKMKDAVRQWLRTCVLRHRPSDTG